MVQSDLADIVFVHVALGVVLRGAEGFLVVE
jgi:hypothetical protein